MKILYFISTADLYKVYNSSLNINILKSVILILTYPPHVRPDMA